MAEYLHTIKRCAIESEMQRFRARRPDLKTEHLRIGTRSLQHGLVTHFAERLDGLHAARDTVLRQHAGQSTALVVVRQETVSTAFREMKIQLRARGTSRITRDPQHLLNLRKSRRSHQPLPPAQTELHELAELKLALRSNQHSRIYAWERRGLPRKTAPRSSVPTRKPWSLPSGPI